MDLNDPKTFYADKVTVSDPRMDRLVAVLERIADALERANDRSGYDSALARWQAGQGPHPDD